MKKKRGFTLKSGNNLGAKGRKPSNFKMRSGNSPLFKAMGSSPAKVNIDMDLMREVGAKTTEGKIDKY